MFKFQVLKGSEILPLIEDIANLRITVFREYPYLYNGSMEYERKYLGRYISSHDSMLVVAKKDGIVIGAATGNGVINEMEEVRNPLVNAGYQAEQVYYLAELVVLKEYRSKGLGSEFLKIMEEKLRHDKSVKYISLCAVERDRAGQPEGYKPPDSLWFRNGFKRQAEIISYFSWRDINDEQETKKPLVHWIKEI